MKILTVHIFFSPFGGGEVIAYNTYKLFQKMGHKSYFFATDKKPFFENDYEYLNYFPKYEKLISCFIRKPYNYYWNIGAKNNFHKMLEVIKPDIVHIHGIKWLTYSILDACVELNIPVVQTIHDASMVCPVSTLLLNNKHYCKDFKCKSGNYYNCIYHNCSKSGIEGSFRNALFDFIALKTNSYKKISKFITPSIALKNLIVDANIGVPENKIVVINNFLENQYINTEVDYKNKGYFLYSGRLSPEKGVHYLLEAIKELPRDIKFHIVGTGPEEECYKTYIEKNKLTNVKMCGFMERDELLSEYRYCIAGIHPCNWFENFPTSIMEFFASGKPVIGSNIGGISEQIGHNETGFLFKPGNISQLKEYILKYWKNPQLSILHGKNAKQKTINIYNEKRYYDQLISLYKNLI